jgi:tetratricopeptide (TPR) repeat protein
MKRALAVASLACLALVASPVAGQLQSLPPPGDNQRSEVTQWMGPVAVTVSYSSPDVHAPTGEDRSGHIWGELVPWGIARNPFYPGFGTAENIPWRAGANENTTIRFSHDVEVEGKPLAAGTYGFHLIPGEQEWGVIFSRNATSWGSFFYDPAEDALRVTVKPEAADYREWLTYDFVDRGLDSTVLALHWERLRIPIRVSVPDVVDLYVSAIDDEMRNRPGGFWQNWNNAAQFLLSRQARPEKALEYARAGVSDNRGEPNFATLSTLAQALAANGQPAEAKQALQQALAHPTANAGQIHQAGRQLLAAGQKEEALEVFRTNFERFDGAWPTAVGMARGLSAVGRYDEALAHARKALEQARERQDTVNASSLEGMIRKLEAGQDAN